MTTPSSALVLVLLLAASLAHADPVLDWLKSKSREQTRHEALPDVMTKRLAHGPERLPELPWQDYINDFVNGYWYHVPSVVLKKSNGWRSRVLPIQTRFAPFGTKIIPSANSGDSSNTLLRYGRSV